MITGLAHVCFHVRSLDAALAFYRDRLGLAEAFPYLREDGTKFGVYLHVGGRNFIELFEGKVDDTTGRPSYSHFCLEVDDIEQTASELRTRGVEVTDVKLGDDGSLQAWLADPDGNRIELHQYTPESKQAPSLA